MSRRPPIAGAILAGGTSRRFGSDKTVAETPTGPLAGVALSALRAAGADPVVLIGGSPEASSRLEIPSIPDRMPGEGPLAGLWTALTWATGVHRVVVVPCDMPRITASVVRSLINAGSNTTAVVGAMGGEPHPIVGCWPTQWATNINDLLRSGERRMTAALEAGPVAFVEFEQSQMADADDPVELVRLIESDGGLQ
ncbi:MAG: molybdenum cofactor guanylyltransferase [Acidimicrobiia bacterium]|nr:molybdenum cofactor guanylyltransferase [Acidimicrobiia bacterium]